MSTELQDSAATAIQARPVTEYFTGQMPRVPLSTGYKLGLFLVAVAMVLLPIIYLGFIGCLGWAMWWWATHACDWFFPVIGGTRRIFWMLAILYVIPLVVGVILLLYMVASFFSKWRIVHFSAPVSHLDHPELFRFLGQLCQQMGAPIPSRIDVTLDINASAGFREGFKSLFGNDVMLTIGLPLVASMSVREFAAVMAHELGHFTQRSAMRCEFVIHHVQGWLSRTVYESDDLHAWTDQESNGGSVELVIYVFSRIAITFTRGVMWLLLLLSHALTSFLSRQMEFHADACAAGVAGSDGFVAMLYKLRLLGVSFEQAGILLKNRVAPKYPDDLASYIANRAGQSSAQFQGKVAQAAAKQKTRWFESHPADQERTDRVTRGSEPGIIQDDRPATALFQDFGRFSRSLTLAAYQLPGRRKPITPAQIFAVEAQSEQTVPDTATEEALVKAYFGGLGLVIRPLLPATEGRVGAVFASNRVEQWKSAKALLEQNTLTTFRERLKQFDARMLQTLQANALLLAGIAFRDETFPQLGGELDDLPSKLASLQAEQTALANEMEPFEAAAKKRLLAALNMLATPDIASRLPQSRALQDEVRDLLHVCAKLGAAFPALLELRQEFAVLQTLLHARGQPGTDLTRASESAAACSRLLAQVHSALGSAAFPFKQGVEPISIIDYARAKKFDADPARMVQLEAESHLQMLFALYYLLLGRLVTIALQVECLLEGPS